MPGETPTGPVIAYVYDPIADEHRIGLQDGAYFVPFVSVSGVRYRDRLAAAASPEAQAAAPTPDPSAPGEPGGE